MQQTTNMHTSTQAIIQHVNIADREAIQTKHIRSDEQRVQQHHKVISCVYEPV